MRSVSDGAGCLVAELDLARTRPVTLVNLCRYFDATVLAGPTTQRASVRIADGRSTITLACHNLSEVKESPELRFTLAHELGHIFLARIGVLKPFGRKEYWKQETLCDLFARLILCPDASLVQIRALPSSVVEAVQFAQNVARLYCVPLRIACDRISDLVPRFKFILFRREIDGTINATASSFRMRTARGVKLRAEEPEDAALYSFLHSMTRPAECMELPHMEFNASVKRLQVESAMKLVAARLRPEAWLLGLEFPGTA